YQIPVHGSSLSSPCTDRGFLPTSCHANSTVPIALRHAIRFSKHLFRVLKFGADHVEAERVATGKRGEADVGRAQASPAPRPHLLCKDEGLRPVRHPLVRPAAHA